MTLLDRIRSSDQEGWRRFVILYTPLIAYWCRRQGVSREDADDVTQEVLRAVASGIGDFRQGPQGSSFRGWLRSVTHHKAIDWRRYQSRQPAGAVGGTEAGLMLQGLPEGGDGGEDDPEQLSGLFRRALDLVRGEFEAKTWRAFWSVVVEGRETADVAR